MSQHYNPRRYQAPAVWAHVRADYLAGETARVVAERYGVSVASLRKRSSEEGWTRAAHALVTQDRFSPPTTDSSGPAPRWAEAAPEATDLPDMIAAALQRAGRQIAAGRGAEAASTLKAVEALRRLHADLGAAPDAPSDDAIPGPGSGDGASPAAQQAALEATRDFVIDKADQLVRRFLGDHAGGAAVLWSACALHWRARHLGPEAAAAADRAEATARGWARAYWDADGRLLPLADLLARDRRSFIPNVDPDDPALPPIDAAPAWLDPILPG